MKLSYSQIETYKLCPHKWKFHYIDGYRPDYIGSPLFFGSALGAAWAQMLLKKKIDLTDDEKNILDKNTKEYFDELYQSVEINGIKYDLPTCTKVTYFKNDFQADILNDQDREVIENYRKANGFNDVTFDDLYGFYKAGNVDEDELKYLNFQFWVSTRRKAHYLIDSYEKEILPRVLRVYSIEEPISIKNNSGDEIIGFIDLIAEIVLDGGQIIKAVLDHKTSSKKYNEKKFEESGQLHLYNYVKELGSIGYIVGVKEIKKPKIGPRKGEIYGELQLLTQASNPETEERFILEADQVLGLIKSESYPKNKDACLSFGARCAFYEICQGSGKMDGLIKKEQK